MPGTGNRIRAIREERGKMVPAAFTLAAVARRLGVTEGMVRRWELGTNRPRPRHARALARELGVSVEELQLEDGAPEDDGVERPGHDETEQTS
jgi:transcriptional regulator with XRE-family HTH domain